MLQLYIINYIKSYEQILLFVDFNGVISYDPFWKSLLDKNHILNRDLQRIEDFVFKENFDLILDWMVGKYNSEDIHKIISKELDIDYTLLFDNFVSDCKKIDISEKILNKLKSIKSNYVLILATGNMDSFDRFTLPNNKYLYNFFDEIHNSFNFGLLKTTNNGEYFKKIIKKYNLNPKNSYLIDDSNSTCKIFSDLGGTSFRTKTENDVLDIISNKLSLPII